MSPTAEGRTDPRFVQHLLELDYAFSREDEGEDAAFYAAPRFVSHLDETALSTVERLIEGLVTEKAPAILDLMASTDSHLPATLKPSRVTGLGMNAEELRGNPDLTEWIVQDLNSDPVLPFEDSTFDAVLNVVSVEYLTQPERVFAEAARVLKQGGLFLVVFSNRWFPPKVVRVWDEAKEEERLGLVEEFFKRTQAFENSDFFISMGLPRPEGDQYFPLGVPSDPVFAVFAEKKGVRPGRRPRCLFSDPAQLERDEGEVRDRKMDVGKTMECPHCQQRLSKWEVPDDPCIDWPNDHLYLCFNDSCPFVVRGWRHMWNQGIAGVSYRFLFNPATGACNTVPIRSLVDLRPGIVEEAVERVGG